MKNYEFIDVSVTKQIATITLNRPDKRNAMHAAMVKELIAALSELSEDESRVLIMEGKGECFCAGGDIHWMQHIAEAPIEENDRDALLLANLFHTLYTFPKPTIVLAHGAVMGGGLGLLTACDIAMVSEDATFCFSEVKIGLIPAMISPYAIDAMGERWARYYFLTAEKFDAITAVDIGLAHQAVPRDALKQAGLSMANHLIQQSPQALQKCKALLRLIAKQPITQALMHDTAKILADMRKSPEAQEGLKAFMEKRQARW